MVEVIFLLLTVAGLIIFEIVSSIDNAVINADVLSTMSKKARRWFLFWSCPRHARRPGSDRWHQTAVADDFLARRGEDKVDELLNRSARVFSG